MKYTSKSLEVIVISFFLFLTALSLASCKNRPSKRFTKAQAVALSREHIGAKEYDRIVKEFIDTIELINEIYPEYLAVCTSPNFKISTDLFFNKEKNRYISTIIRQDYEYSSLTWILGFKYGNEWFFFRPKTAMFLFNDKMGFENGELIPMQWIEDYGAESYNHYIKRNQETNTYEISNEWFFEPFENPGWYNSRDSMTKEEYLTAPDSFWVEKYMNKVRERQAEITKRGAERDSLERRYILKD